MPSLTTSIDRRPLAFSCGHTHFLAKCLSLLLVLAGFSAVSASEPPSTAAVELFRGRKPLGGGEEHNTSPYRKRWALIIGINYDDATRSERDRISLPVLRNAENDSKALRDVLAQYYGYSPENILYNEVGAQGTKRWIEEQLLKVCDPAVVSPEDSLLVFFSGHGARIESTSDQGALFPYDVRFSEGRPLTGTFLRMHSDLVNVIAESPARHKLLVLDSCYSGEVFNIGARPRSETDDRSAPALADEPCLQAIASCRSTQVASDGSGEHSPFMSVLLSGLKQLPDRHDGASRIWTNWLFAYMRPDLTLPNGQAPDCRNLQGDGEFSFHPDLSQDFTAFRGDASDFQLLQSSASVGSEQGRWWFQEMPWFIPSLRETFMKRLPPSRSGLEAVQIRRLELQKVALAWADEDSPCVGTAEKDLAVHAELSCLRRKHLKLLLDEAVLAKSELASPQSSALKTIAADLSDEAMAAVLEPADWHLLAVVQHALKDQEADRSYRKAITGYGGGDPATVRGAATPAKAATSDAHRALLALCRADFGEFLMSNTTAHGKDAYQEAAHLFRQAHDEFHRNGPTSFRVFVRCQEAKAWLAMNRWAEVDRCLSDALDFAKALGPRHYLGAFVHRDRAWAQMTMWRISLAEESFKESNRILEAWMSDLAVASADGAGPAVANDSAERLAEDDLEQAFTVSHRVRNSPDHQARIVYLHNLHGLAMAQRYHGRTALATRKYRWLAMECEFAISQLRSSSGETERSAEADLLSRVTNTLERLGDCNLFGDPTVRDLPEALDDYQRAEGRIHWLSEDAHLDWRSKLFYKQALALSLPSRMQDPGLALDLCREADRLFAPKLAAAAGLEQALGTLTTPVVELVATNPKAELLDGDEPDERLQTARTGLRTALYTFRTSIGANPHRDQLEMSLFAADALLNHGQEQDRFQLSQDIDLLLSFCGIALSPPELQIDQNRPIGEARDYLRPYYDTAMTHLLRLELRDARKLLRVQWEATHGTLCPKNEELQPTLALYILKDEPLLLYQLPDGDCHCLPLSNEYASAEILDVSQNPSLAPLALPRKVEEAFRAWHQKQPLASEFQVDCRLGNAGSECLIAQPEAPAIPEPAPVPATFANAPPADTPLTAATTVSTMKLPLNCSRFPFKLPAGFHDSTAAQQQQQQR